MGSKGVRFRQVSLSFQGIKKYTMRWGMWASLIKTTSLKGRWHGVVVQNHQNPFIEQKSSSI